MVASTALTVAVLPVPGKPDMYMQLYKPNKKNRSAGRLEINPVTIQDQGAATRYIQVSGIVVHPNISFANIPNVLARTKYTETIINNEVIHRLLLLSLIVSRNKDNHAKVTLAFEVNTSEHDGWNSDEE